MAGPTTEVDG